MANLPQPLLLFLAFFGVIFLGMTAWEAIGHGVSWLLWTLKNREDYGDE